MPDSDVFVGGALSARSRRRLVVQVRVALAEAVGAEPVAEAGVGMLLNVAFHALPVTRIVADFLTAGADREQSAQSLDVGQRRLQVANERFALGLGLLAGGDHLEIDRDARLARIDSHLIPVGVGRPFEEGLKDPRLPVTQGFGGVGLERAAPHFGKTVEQGKGEISWGLRLMKTKPVYENSRLVYERTCRQLDMSIQCPGDIPYLHHCTSVT